MKRIKSFRMYERLGVPEGNVELGIDLYDYIVGEFNKTPNKVLYSEGKIDQNNDLPMEEVSLTLKGDYEISGLPVKEIRIDLKILSYEGAGESEHSKGDFSLINANVTAGEEFSPGFVNKREKIETITIRATFVSEAGKDLTYGDFAKYLVEDEEMIVSTFSHEIKHVFDSAKRATKFSDLADYSSFQSTKFDIPAINDFLFYLYNAHKTEDLVRPSEIAAIIKKKGIKKKDFVNFLDQNHTVKKIKRIRDWSYEGMKKQLLEEIDIIKERLTDSGIPVPETDEETVDLILKLLHTNIQRNSISAFKGLYREIEREIDPFSFLNALFGGKPTPSEYQKEIDDFIKSKSYSDYNKFFLDQEKNIKTTADKTIRKLSKLYDLAESEELDFEEDENSIVDMEIYHKLNGIKTNIEKFKDF
jgi:hypothetical protein